MEWGNPLQCSRSQANTFLLEEDQNIHYQRAQQLLSSSPCLLPQEEAWALLTDSTTPGCLYDSSYMIQLSVVLYSSHSEHHQTSAEKMTTVVCLTRKQNKIKNEVYEQEPRSSDTNHLLTRWKCSASWPTVTTATCSPHQHSNGSVNSDFSFSRLQTVAEARCSLDAAWGPLLQVFKLLGLATTGEHHTIKWF